MAPIPILLSALTAARSSETTCGRSSAAIRTSERTVERTRRRRYVPPAAAAFGRSDVGGRWRGEREACRAESSWGVRSGGRDARRWVRPEMYSARSKGVLRVCGGRLVSSAASEIFVRPVVSC